MVEKTEEIRAEDDWPLLADKRELITVLDALLVVAPTEFVATIDPREEDA